MSQLKRVLAYDAGGLLKHCSALHRSNSVNRARYTLLTFLPLFLHGQFCRPANLYFLLVALLQQMPSITATWYSTLVPLSIILLFTAAKEIWEDLKRHRADRRENRTRCHIYSVKKGSFIHRRWHQITVGSIIKVCAGETFPADMILLTSSSPTADNNGAICYVNTANIDGESTLKIRRTNGPLKIWSDWPAEEAPHASSSSYSSTFHAGNGRGGPLRRRMESLLVKCKEPNGHVEGLQGIMLVAGEGAVPLEHDQMLLRSSQLVHTEWVIGIAIYTGMETKMMISAGKTRVKQSTIERTVDRQNKILVALILATTIGMALCARLVLKDHPFKRIVARHIPLSFSESQLQGSLKETLIGYFYSLAMAFVLIHNLVPISMVLTIEMLHLQLAELIRQDSHIGGTLVNVSGMISELGLVRYLFSDKTGTLTKNEMTLKSIACNGCQYALKDCSLGRSCGAAPSARMLSSLLGARPEGVERPPSSADAEVHMAIAMAICNTVVPVEIDREAHERRHRGSFISSSPDEVAIVDALPQVGIRLVSRESDKVTIEVGCDSSSPRLMTFQIMAVLEFSSARMRMSIIVRDDEHRIWLYCKGADCAVWPRLRAGCALSEPTAAIIDSMATKGLRTLAFAVREVSERDWLSWSKQWAQCQIAVEARQELLDSTMNTIESGLWLVGATGVEDCLQEGVVQTIKRLQEANINVWILTGDKLETALNVAYSSQIISRTSNVLKILDAEDHTNICRQLDMFREAILNGDSKDNVIVVDFAALQCILDERPLEQAFIGASSLSKSVICARTSPLQKAHIVECMQRKLDVTCMAIGDGGNDVEMIRKASIGVGIRGAEGMLASRAADFSIKQFKFVDRLILVHGAWSYNRVAKAVTLTIYKNTIAVAFQFIFLFYSLASAQEVYHPMMLTLYNVLFTSILPIGIGVTEQFLSDATLSADPRLYIISQSGSFFSGPIFWKSIASALSQALVSMWGISIIAAGSVSQYFGTSFTLNELGCTLYAVILVTVTIKAALMTNYWCAPSVACMLFGPLAWIVYIVAVDVCSSNPALCPGAPSKMAGIGRMLLSSDVFWSSIIILPALCSARDIAWKFYQRRFTPMPYHLAQDAQRAEKRSRSAISFHSKDAHHASSISTLGSIPQHSEPHAPSNLETP